jgi:hypothetical protein
VPEQLAEALPEGDGIVAVQRRQRGHGSWDAVTGPRTVSISLHVRQADRRMRAFHHGAGRKSAPGTGPNRPFSLQLV